MAIREAGPARDGRWTVDARSPDYASFLETIPDAALLVDDQSRVLHANTLAEEIFRYPAGELAGQLLESLIPRDRRSRHARNVAAFLAQPHTRPMGTGLDLEALRRDGSAFAVDIMLRPLESASGPVVACIVRDVTERRRIEKRLEESERNYRQLLEGASETFYRVEFDDDPMQGRVTFMSQTATGHAGHTRDECLADPAIWMSLLHPEDREAVGESTRRILASGRRGTRLYRMLDEEKRRYRWFEDQLTPILDGDGRATGFHGVVRDVTERTHHLQELEALATMSSALRQSRSRAEMPSIILGKLRDLLEADGAALARTDAATGETVIELGLGEWASGTGWRIPPGDGLSGAVITSGEPFVSEDVRADGRFSRPDLLGTICGVAAVPLKLDDRAIGALWIGRRTPIATEEVHVLSAIANMAASALHRAALFEQVREDARDLAEAYEGILEGWSRALELRDRETLGHTLRVTDLTLRLAEAMGVPPETMSHLRRGVLLHDIGKMGVPDTILLKAGPLTEDEWAVMKLHPVHAREMLAPIPYLRPSIDIPYCHHERWDGSGYPRGLRGEEIPLAARIFSVVDVYDALSSDRPYREAWPRERVLEHLRAEAGRHFDPAVVETFLRVVGA